MNDFQNISSDLDLLTQIRIAEAVSRVKTSTDRICFAYRVLCGAGVLVKGSSDDFLACVQIAREKKAEWTSKMVGSVLRVQIFYPNRKQVPSSDLVAAYAALDALAPQTEFGCPLRPSIGQLVLIRRAAAAQISPAHSEARTAEICAAAGNKFRQSALISKVLVA